MIAVREPIVLATRSLGKLHELRPIFDAAGARVIDLDEAGIPEQPDEEGIERWETFEENALAKARHFFALAGGRPTVADDSGLEVLALAGRPGVHTKRFSGRYDLAGRALDEANIAKLLAEIDGVDDRRARYVCVAAWVDEHGEHTFRGETTGRILHAPRGTGGFGYDPVFLSDDLGVTFAEVDRAVKEPVSHRGRAFAQLVSWLTHPR